MGTDRDGEVTLVWEEEVPWLLQLHFGRVGEEGHQSRAYGRPEERGAERLISECGEKEFTSKVWYDCIAGVN